MSRFLAVTLLFVVACGGASGPVIDRAPDEPILVVTEEGGFAPVADVLGRVPRYVVLADGTVFTPGAVPAIHPGPLMTPISTSVISDEDLARIVDLVTEIGLPGTDEIVDDTPTNIADATTTVVTWIDNGGEHRLAVYALGITQDESTLARATAELIAAIDRAVVGAGDPTEWEPERLEIRTGDPLGADEQFVTTRPWPFSVAPDAMVEVQPGWRCAVIDGADVGRVLDEVRAANQATEWTWEDRRIPLVVKPLLPGQAGCA